MSAPETGQPSFAVSAAATKPASSTPGTVPTTSIAEVVIPVHYDTFPPIETDAEAYKADVESGTSSRVELLKPGETLQLDAARLVFTNRPEASEHLSRDYRRGWRIKGAAV